MTALHRLSAAFVAALVIALGLAACGAGDEQPRDPPPVKETVFGDVVETMDKSRAVEDTMKQRNEELGRAVDAAEAER